MARLSRADLYNSSEIAIVHVMSSVVQNAYLLGDDPLTGKNYDHRKQWIEAAIMRSAAVFGIDLIAYSLMSTHMHLVLRSRPDMVAKWDDTEVARRWLMLCPVRKNKDGSPKEPSEPELNTIRNNPVRLSEIRSRLSDISWWMRLLCQRIGQRANREAQKSGNFWQTRYRAVRLLDEAAVLACAAYVDLNPIRAAMAETIENSEFTSARKRFLALRQQLTVDGASDDTRCDSFLVPVELVDDQDESGTLLSTPQEVDSAERLESGQAAGLIPERSRRCSDKGFASLSAADYLQLLDWTARQIVPGKRGSTPEEAPPIFQRLDISVEAWCELVHYFQDYFFLVAGKPEVVDAYRSRLKEQRFKIPKATREVMATT